MSNGFKQLPPEEKEYDGAKRDQAILAGQGITGKLDEIRSRETDILKGINASTPQATIKSLVKEYFDLQKTKEEYFQEIGKAWGPAINSATSVRQGGY